MAMLGAGTFGVIVREIRIDNPPNGGPEQVCVAFEEPETGDFISWFSSLGWLKDGGFSKKALDYALDQLAAIGWDGRQNGMDLSDLVSGRYDGTPVDVVVKEEVYNGVARAKVAFINDPNNPRGPRERMDPAEAQSRAQQMRAKLLAQMGPQQPAQRPAAKPPARPAPSRAPQSSARPVGTQPNGQPADDGIPF